MIPYTTIPFASAFFLVLVGVLIGHLIWSSSRTKHRRTIVQLRRKIERQRHELKSRAKQCEALSHDAAASAQCADDQASELEQLRHQCRLLEASQEELSDRLARETQARKDLAVCLEDEHQRHEAATRQVELLRKRVAEDQADYDEMRRKLSTATNLHRALNEQLKATERSNQTALADSQQQLDCATQELSVVSQRCAALHHEKEELAEQFQQVDDARRQLMEQLAASRHGLAQLHVLLDQRQQELDAAGCREAEADRLTLELRAQITEVDRLTVLTRSLREDLESSESARRQLEDQYRALVALNESLSVELTLERTKQEQLDTTSSRLRSQLDEARREVDRLALVEDRVIELEAQCRQAESEIKRLRRERDDAMQVEAASRRIVNELRDELNERLDEVDSLRREKESAASQLEFESRQRRQIAEALQATESRLAVVQTEREAASDRQSKLIGQVTDLTDQVRQWQAQAHDLEQRSLRAERQVAELARQLDNQQQLADKLRRRRFTANTPDSDAEVRSGLSFRDLRDREAESSDASGDLLAPDGGSSRVA